jgi:hypothetical protein
MKLTEAISRRIIDLCTERNLTPDMVLQNADASSTAVAMVISGSDNLIMLDVMQSICDVHEITMGEFFKCDLFAGF